MKGHFSYIRKWLRFYMAGVLSTALIVFFLIYREMDSFLTDLSGALSPDAPAELIAMLNQNTAALRYRLLLLLAAGTVIIACGGFLWLRLGAQRLSRPIVTIRRALFRLSHGKLNETIAFESGDEFAEIGLHFNELAANLQELLLYVWKQTGLCLEQLKTLNFEGEAEHGSRWSTRDEQCLERLRSGLHDLRTMAKAYVFYDVLLESGRAVAASEPGIAPSAKAPET